MIALAAAAAAASAAVGAWAAAASRGGPNSADEAAIAAYMAAAKAGRISELTEMVEGGQVHVDARAEDGSTALAACAVEGHGNAVRLLLALGADWKLAVHAAAASGQVSSGGLSQAISDF